MSTRLVSCLFAVAAFGVGAAQAPPSQVVTQVLQGAYNVSQFPGGLPTVLDDLPTGGHVVHDTLDLGNTRAFYFNGTYQIVPTVPNPLPNQLLIEDFRLAHALRIYHNWGAGNYFAASANAEESTCMMSQPLTDAGALTTQDGVPGLACHQFVYSSTADGFSLGGIGDTGAPGGWLGQTVLPVTGNMWGAGIHSLIGMSGIFTGIGDTNALNEILYVKNGAQTSGDEGLVGHRIQSYDVPNMVGTIVSGGAGATVLSIQPVSNGQYVGVGHPLVDMTDDVWSCAMSVTNTGVNSPGLAVLTGCTTADANGKQQPVIFPASSLVAALANELVVPRVGESTFTDTFQVKATDSSANSATNAVSMRVVAGEVAAAHTTTPANGGPVTIAPMVSDGTINLAYTATIGVSGGTGPYTCALASGHVPGGIRLHSDCTLTGVPNLTTPTTFQLTLLPGVYFPDGTFIDMGTFHDETVHIYNVDPQANLKCTSTGCTETVTADLQYTHEGNSKVYGGGLVGRKLDQVAYDTPLSYSAGGGTPPINQYLFYVTGSIVVPPVDDQPEMDEIMLGAQMGNAVDGAQLHAGSVILYHGATVKSVKVPGKNYADGSSMVVSENDAAWATGAQVINTTQLFGDSTMQRIDQYESDPYRVSVQHNDSQTGYGGAANSWQWASVNYLPNGEGTGVTADFTQFKALGGAYHPGKGLSFVNGPYRYAVSMNLQPMGDSAGEKGYMIGFGQPVSLTFCSSTQPAPCLNPQMDAIQNTSNGDALTYDNAKREWLFTAQTGLTVAGRLRVLGYFQQPNDLYAQNGYARVRMISPGDQSIEFYNNASAQIDGMLEIPATPTKDKVPAVPPTAPVIRLDGGHAGLYDMGSLKAIAGGIATSVGPGVGVGVGVITGGTTIFSATGSPSFGVMTDGCDQLADMICLGTVAKITASTGQAVFGSISSNGASVATKPSVTAAIAAAAAATGSLVLDSSGNGMVTLAGTYHAAPYPVCSDATVTPAAGVTPVAVRCWATISGTTAMLILVGTSGGTLNYQVAGMN